MSDMELYEFISDRLETKNWSWLNIRDYLGYNTDKAAMNKYRRICNKYRLNPFKKKRKKYIRREDIDRKAKMAQPEVHDILDEEYSSEKERIDSIPYGELEPSFYVSDLDMYSWIWEYIDFFDGEFEEGTEEFIAAKIDWALPYLAEIANELWLRQEEQIQLPRGYGKTEITIAVFTRWYLEIMGPLYVVGPSNGHIEAILDRLMSHCEYWKVRRDYGDMLG